MIERPGVNPKFKAVKAYLKLTFPGTEDAWEGRQLLQLKRFRAEGIGYAYSIAGRTFEYNELDLGGDLFYVCLGWRTRAFRAALAGQADWLSEWHRSVAYGYWCQRIDHRYQQDFLARYHRKEVQEYSGSQSLNGLAGMAADCLLLGWQEKAIDLARRANWALDYYGCYDQGEAFHRRTQLFVLRLISRWQGWPARNGPSWAYDQPIFNALVEQWNTPEPDDLAPLLLAALDHHTHQSAKETNTKEFDFTDPSYWYHPYEALVVLKLRQLAGLTNPVLEHPLTTTPLGQLPPEAPVYTDELLEGIITQAQAVFPDI